MNSYKNLTASGLVKTGQGTVSGIIVASHSSGTIKLWDAVTAAVPVLVNTMTLATGERYIPLYDANFTTGLYVTIGGTADITVVYN
jgi:hypothetical protein